MTDQQMKMQLTKLKREIVGEIVGELKRELEELKDAKAKKFYSQREAAELCGVSPTTLRRAMHKGKLGGTKTGDPKGNGRVYISASELVRYQEEHIVGAI